MRFAPLLLAALFMLGGIATATAVAQAVDLPPGAGRDRLMAACTRCHGIDVIVTQRRTPDEWQEVMSVMIGHGAQMTDEDYQAIVSYLSTALGPAVPAGSSHVQFGV